MDSRPTVIDLFCGAGGLSEGFRQARYRVLLGSDIDLTFGETFSRSHNGAAFIAKPIQSLSSIEILTKTGLCKGQLDVLVGGPPCQGYSVYNHGRGEHDPRAGLFREYLRIVRDLAPKWLVMENVTGLLSISGGQLVKTISEEISKLGYASSGGRCGPKIMVFRKKGGASFLSPIELARQSCFQQWNTAKA